MFGLKNNTIKQEFIKTAGYRQMWDGGVHMCSFSKKMDIFCCEGKLKDITEKKKKNLILSKSKSWKGFGEMAALQYRWDS